MFHAHRYVLERSIVAVGQSDPSKLTSGDMIKNRSSDFVINNMFEYMQSRDMGALQSYGAKQSK